MPVMKNGPANLNQATTLTEALITIMASNCLMPPIMEAQVIRWDDAMNTYGMHLAMF